MSTAEYRTPAPAASTWRRQLNLIRELAVTQFKLKYTGSILGYVWSLVKPLMLFGVTYVVFAVLFNAGSQAPFFTLQLLLAIVLFTFFAETTSTAMNAVVSNGHIIRRAYFPRPILVVAATASSLLTFTINLLLVLVVAGLSHQVTLGSQSFWALAFFVELYLLALGVSLFLSSLFVFYRDLGHIWEIVSQVLLYGSAVVYPFSLKKLLDHPHMRELLALNPMAQIIEDMRHALITPQAQWTAAITGWPLYIVPLAAVLLILVIGAATFRILEPRFAENL